MDINKITGFSSIKSYAEYLTMVGNSYKQGGFEATAQDYLTMANVVRAIETQAVGETPVPVSKEPIEASLPPMWERDASGELVPLELEKCPCEYAEASCSKRHEEGYVCSLDEGHEGAHIACGGKGKHKLRVWTSLKAPESKPEIN